MASPVKKLLNLIGITFCVRDGVMEKSNWLILIYLIFWFVQDYSRKCFRKD